MEHPDIPYRLAILQRVFPAYRAGFFDMLANACKDGLSIYAGNPMEWEALGQGGVLTAAILEPSQNIYLGHGVMLFVWQRGIARWLERWQPHVLIADTNPRNVSTSVALGWMRQRQRPVIGWGLGAPPQPGLVGALMERSRRGFLSRFDALIAYSQAGVSQYVAAGFPRDSIFTACNAVTPRPVEPPPERPAYYIGGKPVVLFVGRLQARKRVDALLRACAALPELLQPRLVIVGDGPVRSELENLAKSVYPPAEFVGEKRGALLEPFYSTADLFVLPGTGGLAVQQAMGFGLPVIVAEADGTQSDLLRTDAQGRAPNGWVVPAGDDLALVSCLAEALSDPSGLRRMGQESYRVVSEEVNLERMVAVFANAVQFVMRLRPPAGVQ